MADDAVLQDRTVLPNGPTVVAVDLVGSNASAGSGSEAIEGEQAQTGRVVDIDSPEEIPGDNASSEEVSFADPVLQEGQEEDLFESDDDEVSETRQSGIMANSGRRQSFIALSRLRQRHGTVLFHEVFGEDDAMEEDVVDRDWRSSANDVGYAGGPRDHVRHSFPAAVRRLPVENWQYQRPGDRLGFSLLGALQGLSAMDLDLHEVEVPPLPEYLSAHNFDFRPPAKAHRVDSDSRGQREGFGSGYDSMSINCRKTCDVRAQLDQLEACPIQYDAMLDPVRLVHEDEEVRVGAPHVMNRKAAEKWFTQDTSRSCPLCRTRVRELRPEKNARDELDANISRLARETFQGGDNLLHKAVKLLDSGLFAAVGRFLPHQEVSRMLTKSNNDGHTPLKLLGLLHEPAQQIEFILDLPRVGGRLKSPLVVFCPRSAAQGGSPFWCSAKPIFMNSQFEGPGGGLFFMLLLCGNQTARTFRRGSE
jgi:hypothetical protein